MTKTSRLAATFTLTLAAFFALAAGAQAAPARQIVIMARVVALQSGAEVSLSPAWASAEALPGTPAPTVQFAHGNFDIALAALVAAGRAKMLCGWQQTTPDNVLAQFNLSFTLPSSRVEATPAYDCENRNLKVIPVLLNCPNALAVTPRLNADGSVTLNLQPRIMVSILAPPPAMTWGDELGTPDDETLTGINLGAPPQPSPGAAADFTVLTEVQSAATVAPGETLAIAGAGPSRADSVDVITLLTPQVK